MFIYDKHSRESLEAMNLWDVSHLNFENISQQNLRNF